MADAIAENASALLDANAKTRRVSVCNALDTLIIHSSRLDDLPALVADMADKQVEILADSRAAASLKGYHWNAPTSFTDGAQFGLGAEIGISTQKLGPRGPMGLEEITTYKWLIEGEGQVRS